MRVMNVPALEEIDLGYRLVTGTGPPELERARRATT